MTVKIYNSYLLSHVSCGFCKDEIFGLSYSLDCCDTTVNNAVQLQLPLILMRCRIRAQTRK